MYNNTIKYNNHMIPINEQFLLNNPNNDERFLGGFLGPFILGGITGGLVAPFFNNQNNGYYYQPPYYTNNYYYPPYYYGPYYY